MGLDSGLGHLDMPYANTAEGFRQLQRSLSEALSRLFSTAPPVTGLWIPGLFTLILLIVTIRLFRPKGPSYAKFPLASLDGEDAKSSWFNHGRKLMLVALEKYSNRPFKVMTGTGPKIIVPNRFANELRNNPALNFNKAFIHDFFPQYPGMEPLKEFSAHDSITAETIRTKLTQSLGLVTEHLVDETTACLRDLYGDDFDGPWRTVVLKETVLDLVTRLSSRVFLGEALCREAKWLAIAKTYAVDAVMATFALRRVPAVMRPIVHWFMAECRRCRQAVKDAHKMIDGEVARRRATVDECLKAGKKAPKIADTIGWMHETAMKNKAKVDYVAAQLSLTMAAIHTTTEVTCQALFDICSHPEVLEPLREEIISVVGKHGWAKTSLYHLKFMDSFLKESSRARPRNLGMSRLHTVFTLTLPVHTHLLANHHPHSRSKSSCRIRRPALRRDCPSERRPLHHPRRVLGPAILPGAREVRRLAIHQGPGRPRPRKRLVHGVGERRANVFWNWKARLPGPLLCCQRGQDRPVSPVVEIRLALRPRQGQAHIVQF